MKIIPLEPPPPSVKPEPPRLWYRLGHLVVVFWAVTLFRFKSRGGEQLPPKGGCIIAANHVSFLDPPLVGLACYPREIHYFARKDLFSIPLLSWLIRSLNAVGIDRDGGMDIAGVRKALQLLKNGRALLMFPEGTRSYDSTLRPPLPGIGMILARSGVPVVPVRIFGAEKAWPRHKKFPRPARVSVTIGQPFRVELTPEESKSRATYQAISDEVMRRIAELKPPS